MDGCQKVNAMLVLLDTEFTAFVRPDLISIGLVAKDGREFYAERTDYHRDACSDFVRESAMSQGLFSAVNVGNNLRLECYKKLFSRAGNEQVEPA